MSHFPTRRIAAALFDPASVGTFLQIAQVVWQFAEQLDIYYDPNEPSRDAAPTQQDTRQDTRQDTPQDIAIMAMTLWRNGQWTREQAMSVVQAALGEHRAQPNSQPVQFNRAALPQAVPAADAELLEILFNRS